MGVPESELRLGVAGEPRGAGGMVGTGQITGTFVTTEWKGTYKSLL